MRCSSEGNPLGIPWGLGEKSQGCSEDFSGNDQRIWTQATDTSGFTPQLCMAQKQGIPETSRRQRDTSGGYKAIHLSGG